jgi:ubiquinone/menaquinone biosynthesis C-methylase UbiE
VLDVGCGLGDVLSQLPENFNLFGVDYAKSNVAYAKQKLIGKAEIFESGIYSLPFESEYFDIALCLEVLEHIEDDAKAVREISRVLKPGGVLIAAVPYTYYWKSYKKLLGHFRHYTRQSFSALLLKNGFNTIDKYLPNYYRWHQKYSRNYASLVAQHRVMSFFKRINSLYEFKYPWSEVPAINKLELKLEYQKQLDEELDYASDDHSTFIAAQK